MCLIIFGLKAHPRYKLVMIANRDEFYARPSLEAHFWEENAQVLAGKDLQAGGTWLGVHKKGRFSALTNYRDPKNIKENAPSRGDLITNYLLDNIDPLKYMFQVQLKAAQYNGFNLLVGDSEDVFYYSNYSKSIQKVSSGVHGLSNHLLDTYWYKVALGKEKLENYLNNHQELKVLELLDLLEDESKPEDESHIQQTGLSIEQEKMLSSMFIRSPLYGTCCSTVFLWDNNDEITFVEKTYKEGQADKIVEYKFTVEA
jgi:uncharacterized protein with NRDE domain